MQLSTGMFFIANLKGASDRRVWLVMEPSMARPGWICQLVNIGTVVHSDELENMEPANG